MTEQTIWIDADGAPGVCKEMVFKASHRHKTPVRVVANRYQQTPKFRWITFQLVEEAQLLAGLVVHRLAQVPDAVDAGAEALELRVLGREALAGRHGCRVGRRHWLFRVSLVRARRGARRLFLWGPRCAGT